MPPPSAICCTRRERLISHPRLSFSAGRLGARRRTEGDRGTEGRFFGIYLGRGRLSQSNVFTLELFPGGRPSCRNRCDIARHGVVLFQSDDYFSASVPLFQIADSLRDLPQAVAPVDERCYLSGRHEVAQDDQVVFARFRQERDQLLAR